jgi:hypothetical protein
MFNCFPSLILQHEWRASEVGNIKCVLKIRYCLEKLIFSTSRFPHKFSRFFSKFSDYGVVTTVQDNPVSSFCQQGPLQVDIKGQDINIIVNKLTGTGVLRQMYMMSPVSYRSCPFLNLVKLHFTRQKAELRFNKIMVDIPGVVDHFMYMLGDDVWFTSRIMQTETAWIFCGANKNQCFFLIWKTN